MKPSFWHKVWERNSIGFHQNELHPYLQSVLKPKLLESDSSVFVPLCGKSSDMVWLAEHMKVVGCELSEIACRDFFLEKGIAPNVGNKQDFCTYEYKNISLFQGDFFAMCPADIGDFDWVYDRAALIALPVDMQQKYVDHLTSFLTENTRLLLISLEFPQEELSGPPFPIFEADISRLFAGFNVECVNTHELRDKQFAQRVFDVSKLIERAYIITK